MDLIMLFVQLFCTFFIIGIFTFGGGYAMLSLIQAQVVTAHEWISEATFTDIVAISQTTPGPIGINCATYTGYEVLMNAGAGHGLAIAGSFVSTFAIVLPSFLIVLTMARFYQKFMGNPLFEGVMKGISPAVVGLIGAAAVILVVDITWSGMTPDFQIITDNFPDWKSWVLAGAAIVAALKYKVGVINIILAGGVLGLILY